MRKYLKQLRSEFIKHVIERNLDDFFIEWDNNDLDFEGTADEFHNFTTELARAGYYGRACSVNEHRPSCRLFELWNKVWPVKGMRKILSPA